MEARNANAEARSGIIKYAEGFRFQNSDQIHSLRANESVNVFCAGCSNTFQFPVIRSKYRHPNHNPSLPCNKMLGPDSSLSFLGDINFPAVLQECTLLLDRFRSDLLRKKHLTENRKRNHNNLPDYMRVVIRTSTENDKAGTKKKVTYPAYYFKYYDAQNQEHRYPEVKAIYDYNLVLLELNKSLSQYPPVSKVSIVSFEIYVLDSECFVYYLFFDKGEENHVGTKHEYG